MGKATDLVGVGCLPENAVTTLAEFAIFRDLAGVRIEGVTVECKVVRHGSIARFVCVGKDVGQGEGGDVLEARRAL